MPLIGIFFVDATLTLLRRMFRGKRWYEAHRSHAYQHAARLWASHRKVTLAILGINVVKKKHRIFNSQCRFDIKSSICKYYIIEVSQFLTLKLSV